MDVNIKDEDSQYHSMVAITSAGAQHFKRSNQVPDGESTSGQVRYKPKPRSRRSKSELLSSSSLTTMEDDTDPRTTSFLQDTTPTTNTTTADEVAQIRPRSSSRRRAYIIKRPKSAPFYGYVTPRPFTVDDPGDFTTGTSSLLQPRARTSLGGLAKESCTSEDNRARTSISMNVAESSPSDSNAQMKTSNCSTSLSTLCHHERPLSVPPSMQTFNRDDEADSCTYANERGIDRKECRMQINALETFVISSSKSQKESRTASGDFTSDSPNIQTYSSPSTIAGSLLQESRNGERAKTKPVAELYSLVLKPKPLQSFKKPAPETCSDYDDFIKSPVEVSTARSENNEMDESNWDENIPKPISPIPVLSSENQAIQNAFESQEPEYKTPRNSYLGNDNISLKSETGNSFTSNVSVSNQPISSPSGHVEIGMDGEVFIPDLRLDSLVGENCQSFHAEDTPSSYGSSGNITGGSSSCRGYPSFHSERGSDNILTEEDEATNTSMQNNYDQLPNRTDYANIEISPPVQDRDIVAPETFLYESNEEITEEKDMNQPVNDNSSKRNKQTEIIPQLGCDSNVKSNDTIDVNLPIKNALPMPSPADNSNTSQLDGIKTSLKETYALPNKPKINKQKLKDLNQTVESAVGPNISHVQEIDSSKINENVQSRIPNKPSQTRKPSCEYTDPVELHSADILQAGGKIHDRHFKPSLIAMSDDKDSDETHKGKRKQHNPFKRLFARKKGKYNPSADLDFMKSTLPTLEGEKEKVKKEKSSSPRLFKRKNKSKLLSSEPDLLHTDLPTAKYKKEKKVKKTKVGKLTKENIVVIKSSGKSLSDSMPDLATSSGLPEESSCNVMEDGRARAYTDRGIGSTLNDWHTDEGIVSDDDHFYTNVSLNVANAAEAATLCNKETKNNKVMSAPVNSNVNSLTMQSSCGEVDEFRAKKPQGPPSDEIDDSVSPLPVVYNDTHTCGNEKGNNNNINNNNHSKNLPYHSNSEKNDDIYANTEEDATNDSNTGKQVGHNTPPAKEGSLPSPPITCTEDNLGVEKVPIPAIDDKAPPRAAAATTDSINVSLDTTNSSHKGDKLTKSIDSTRSTGEQAGSAHRNRASIETTESDDGEDDHTLWPTAANPLRRPKYAPTRLAAQLMGKSLKEEPALKVSRYTEEELNEEDRLSSPPPVKPKPFKKKDHRDRIERGEVSLEDASVLDNSGMELSPRSDVSSPTVDGKYPSLDDVIVDPDSVCIGGEDTADRENEMPKQVCSLERTPSTLLVRAVVHTARENGSGEVEEAEKKNLHDKNILPSTASKVLQDNDLSRDDTQEKESNQAIECLNDNIGSKDVQLENEIAHKTPSHLESDRDIEKKADGRAINSNSFNEEIHPSSTNTCDSLTATSENRSERLDVANKKCGISTKVPPPPSQKPQSDFKNKKSSLVLQKSNLDYQKTEQKTPCKEDIITPVVKQNRNCQIFRYTDALVTLEERDNSRPASEITKRPPPVKQKPSSWKMKVMLRKFDKDLSKTGPTPPPKPQRQKLPSKKGINTDLIHGALKELDDFIDNDFEDDISISPNTSGFEKSQLLAAVSKEQIPKANETEVEEEKILKSEVPKICHIANLKIFKPVESNEDPHGGNIFENNDNDLKSFEKPIDEKLIAGSNLISRNSVPGEKSTTSGTNGVKSCFLSIDSSEDVDFHNSSCKKQESVTIPVAGGIFPQESQLVNEPFVESSELLSEKRPENEILIAMMPSEDEKDTKSSTKFHHSKSVDVPASGLLHPCYKEDNATDITPTTNKMGKKPFTKSHLPIDVDVPSSRPLRLCAKGDNATNSAIDPQIGHLKTPPPIPEKKSKLNHTTSPTPATPLDAENKVVDIGYEDVLDKISENETVEEKDLNFSSNIQQQPHMKSNQSPTSKRFHFPWRKKSKNSPNKNNNSNRNSKQQYESNKKGKKNTKEDKQKPLQTKIKIDEANGSKQQQGVENKVASKKDKKARSNLTKDKSNPKKVKKNAKSRHPKSIEDVYHEIEEGSAVSEQVQKQSSKKTSSPKERAGSSSSSMASSPASSSPLSAESSDESDYEPVNYVEHESEGAVLAEEDVKLPIRSADSNGYEIPKDKESSNKSFTIWQQSKDVLGSEQPGLIDAEISNNEDLSYTSAMSCDQSNRSERQKLQSISPKKASESELDPYCEKEQIEPYLTFKYPRYLDDGEIYVDSPFFPQTLGKKPDIEEKEAVERQSHERSLLTNLKKPLKDENKIRDICHNNESEEVSSLLLKDTQISKSSESEEENVESQTSKTLNIGENDTPNILRATDPSLLTKDIGSPELATKSDLKETLFKALQDFDFGWSGPGTFSEVEDLTAYTPEVSRRKQENKRYDWKDSESEDEDLVSGNLTHDKPFMHGEEASSGYKPLQSETLSFTTEGKNISTSDTGCTNNITILEATLRPDKGAENTSLSSESEMENKLITPASMCSESMSTVTPTPPPSPQSGKNLLEKGMPGRPQLKKQQNLEMGTEGMSNEKDKGKQKAWGFKKKSKSSSKTSGENTDNTASETCKDRSKATKKGGEEKEKWKWPWQRRGSKEHAPSSNKNTKNDTESILLKADASGDNNNHGHAGHADVKEVFSEEDLSSDICKNKRPCSGSSESSDFNSTDMLGFHEDKSTECHDYFNTFLGSSQCFTLSDEISGIDNSRNSVISSETTEDTGESARDTETCQLGARHDIDLTSAEDDQTNIKPGEQKIDRYEDDFEHRSTQKFSFDQEKNSSKDKPVTDVPWSLFHVPAYHSSCSLEQEDPWKDYSPLEMGIMKSALTVQKQDPRGSLVVHQELKISQAQDQCLSSSEDESNHMETQDKHRSNSPRTTLADDGNEDYKDDEQELDQLHHIIRDDKSAERDCGAFTEEMNLLSTNLTHVKPQIAIRTSSQPGSPRSKPVPLERKTVRRHHSDISKVADDTRLIEFSDIWGALNKDNTSDTSSNDTNNCNQDEQSKENHSDVASFLFSPTTESITLPVNAADEKDEAEPFPDALAAALELKPKTKRLSGPLPDSKTTDISILPDRTNNSDRKKAYIMKESMDESDVAAGANLQDILKKFTGGSSLDEESEVEYDKLPVRTNKLSLRSTLLSHTPVHFEPQMVVPLHTPTEKPVAPRQRSAEKSEYAVPWEESLKAYTPTLPPRQLKRSSSGAPEVDLGRRSPESFTSIDLEEEEYKPQIQNTRSLRKSVSLGGGLDRELKRGSASRERGRNLGKGDRTKKPLFMSFISLFQRSKKGKLDLTSNKSEDDGDGEDNDEVFEAEKHPLPSQLGDNKPPVPPKPEKSSKFEKNTKLLKQAKKDQIDPRHNQVKEKRRISAPLVADIDSVQPLPQGLEGRALCRLLKINEDETRIVEMVRPHTGPLGVFFTKGSEQQDEGLLVNAFQDPKSIKLFAGILGVGDALLEIDGCDIRHLSLEQVGVLMQDKERMIVRVMPAEVTRSAL